MAGRPMAPAITSSSSARPTVKTPSRTRVWKWTLRFTPLPKRWITVSIPVRPRAIHVTAYEIDPKLADYLPDTFRACRAACQRAGIRFTSELVRADFLAVGPRDVEGRVRAGFGLGEGQVDPERLGVLRVAERVGVERLGDVSHAAESIIALRSRDGWNDFVDDRSGTGPGAWQPTFLSRSGARVRSPARPSARLR